MASITSAPTSSSEKFRSRLVKFVRWLTPTKFDCLLALCCLIVTVGLLDPIVEQQLLHSRRYQSWGIGKLGLSLGLTGACFAAVAVAWGWRKLSVRSGLLLSVSCLASVVAFLWSLSEVTRVWTIGSSSYYSDSPDESVRLLNGDSAFGFGLKAVGFALVVFLVLFLVTRAFQWFTDSLKSSSSPSFRLSRTKLMIGLAVLLFAAKTIQDVFFPAGGFLYSINVFGGEGYFGLSLLAVFGFIVFLLLPSWLLTRDIKSRWKFLTLVVLAIAIGTVCVVRISVVQPRLDIRMMIVIIGVALVCFYSALIFVGEQRSVGGELKKNSLSVWSLLPIALLLASGVVVYFFDISTLAGTSVKSFPNIEWSLARKAKIIARRTNYQVGITTNEGMPGVVGSLSDSTPRDLFADLSGHNIQFVRLSGLQPDIDVRNLFGATQMSLSESDVTSEQLQGLSQKAWMLWLLDIRVTNPTGNVTLTPFGNIYIRSGSKRSSDPQYWGGAQRRDGGACLSSILDSLGPQKSLSIQIDFGETTRETVESLSRLSTKANIRIYGACLQGLVNAASKEEVQLSNVYVANFTNTFRPNEGDNIQSGIFKFVLNTDIFVSVAHTHENFWDLAFAKNREAVPKYWPLEASIMNKQKFVDEAQRNHWNFGKDPDKLHRLFLPGAESILSSGPGSFDNLKDVEILGLDPMWLSGVDPQTHYYQTKGWVQYHRGIEFSGLEKLKKLRRLDLNSSVLVEDEKLLTRIPKIEHLQVRFDNLVIPAIDFSICKNLKSLVYFGIPGKSMIADLSSLKKLESLTVIFETENLLSEKEKKNIVAAIPGVKIELIHGSDFVPSPPVEFSEHVKKTISRNSKTLGL